MRKLLTFITLAIVAVIPASASAATTDRDSFTICSPLACASSTDSTFPTVPAHLGDTITITDTTVCTVACGFSTVFQSGTRLGQTLPRTREVTITFNPSAARPTYMAFSHSLDEACAGSGGRLTCHDAANNYGLGYAVKASN